MGNFIYILRTIFIYSQIHYHNNKLIKEKTKFN